MGAVNNCTLGTSGQNGHPLRGLSTLSTSSSPLGPDIPWTKSTLSTLSASVASKRSSGIAAYLRARSARCLSSQNVRASVSFFSSAPSRFRSARSVDPAWKHYDQRIVYPLAKPS